MATSQFNNPKIHKNHTKKYKNKEINKNHKKELNKPTNNNSKIQKFTSIQLKKISTKNSSLLNNTKRKGKKQSS